jgi:glycosyltransferase involved in cell wall biosynthesis
VYHAVSPPAGAVMLLLGKRLGVVTVHDLLPFQVGGYNPGPKLAYARWCITLSAKLADALIVPFTVTKDELVRAHGVPASKIHVVSYGLDHATYHPRPETPRGDRRILYVGELSRAKGVDVLIEAFATLKRRVPDAELFIGGKGKHRQDLEDQARALGAGGVKFLGFVPETDLPELYASSAMMVFPSRYGFGLSMLEAMACGTPVIVTATLDAPEFIGDAGLMIEPGDAAGLAEHMASILLDPAVRERLSKKGIERASQFSWAKTAEDTRRVYEQVLA